MRLADTFAIGGAAHPGPDFPAFELGRRRLYLRRDLGHAAPAILARLAELRSVAGVGNRRSGFVIKLDDADIFARRSRRGGMMRLLLDDIYLGLRARPATELAIAAEALRRGIPVAEPLGAMAEWIAPCAYRGFFLTRAMAGMTLWDFVRTDDDPHVRRHVIEIARGAIATMHRMGLFHADLNLHNLFVTHSRDSFAVVILDLDKARLFRGPLPSRLRANNLLRLRRSARKLDPGLRYLDDDALESLVRL